MTRQSVVAEILDEDGLPPCDPADDCATCCLFSAQRPGESRREWVDRIAATANAVLFRQMMAVSE